MKALATFVSEFAPHQRVRNNFRLLAVTQAPPMVYYVRVDA